MRQARSRASRPGAGRTDHWRIAYASAKEVDSHLRLLAGVQACLFEDGTGASADAGQVEWLLRDILQRLSYSLTVPQGARTERPE